MIETRWERGQKIGAQYVEGLRRRMKERRLLREQRQAERIRGREERMKERAAIIEAKKTQRYELLDKKTRRKCEERDARDDRIVGMRLEERMTLQEIGDAEGISRERVRQLLVDLGERHALELPSRVYEPIPPIQTKCAYRGCEKVIERVRSAFNGHGKHFCLEHRYRGGSKWLLLNPNWKNMTDQERARWKYNNSPEFKAKLREASKRYNNKIKKDPVKWAHHMKLQRECIRRYQIRKREGKV